MQGNEILANGWHKGVSFVERLINIMNGPVFSLLDFLLMDKTTGKHIIWATDTYEELGDGFGDTEPMNCSLLQRHAEIIKPRIQKSLETQQARTRKKAEVFTPAWLCNQMNNYCDEEWFGRKHVFNMEQEDNTWTVMEGEIEFPPQKGRKMPLWQRYVDSRRLEITCGEAPYLVSRYDMATGEMIYPLKKRIGQLDRKLRIVNEQAEDYQDWIKWALRAFEATYGYEYQGDNVLIARINLLMTFFEYHRDRWNTEPDKRIVHKIANRIVWNIWQMDGLKDKIPLGKPSDEYNETSLFDMDLMEEDMATETNVIALPCKIYDWRRDNSILFKNIKGSWL